MILTALLLVAVETAVIEDVLELIDFVFKEMLYMFLLTDTVLVEMFAAFVTAAVDTDLAEF